jgi:3-hydroxyisobutyrate dehydrogenase-like beta-hydroxyacid dehydrogenase
MPLQYIRAIVLRAASMELGFVGIGRMGVRMAKRLVDAGYPLSVFDMNANACAPLVERGAKLLSSHADVARNTDFIMTCLPGPEEVESVMEGPQGIIANARKGALLVEMSTIGPALSRSLAAKARAAGLSYIDAPISNGVGPAETGELTIMIGGDKADYDRAVPVLKHLGNRLYHLGPIGTGNFAKIANQIIYLSYVASFCEITRVGRELGVDVPQMVDVMRNSVAGRPMMTSWEKRLENGDRVAGFQISRILKDLGLGADIASEFGVDIPVLEEVIRTYREAADAGSADLDMTAIYSR